jgi:hypothetical protein
MKLINILNGILTESKTDDIIKNKIEKMISLGIADNESDLTNTANNYAKYYNENIKNAHKSIGKYFDEVINYYNQESVSYKTAFQYVYPIFYDFFKYKEDGLIKDDFQQMTYVEMNEKNKSIETAKKRKELERSINVIYEDNEWKIIRVESKEASCKYGSNTRWCISGSHDNRYHGYGYSENNFIYFIFDKDEEEIKQMNVTYKIAVLVNKSTGKFRVWDAEDTEIENIKFLDRFMRPLFKAIKKDSLKLKNKPIYDKLINIILNTPRISTIREYELSYDNFSFYPDSLTISGAYHETDSDDDDISYTGFFYDLDVLEQTVVVKYWESTDGTYDYEIMKTERTTNIPNKPEYYIDSLQDMIHDIIDHYAE